MDGNITEFIHSKLRGVQAGDGDAADDDLN
jgi:hypothetical protein